MPRLPVALLCVLLCSSFVLADDAAPKPAPQRKPAPVDPPLPEPTLANVSYGEHERHVLDFWQAESATPTPLAFVIHGGGWRSGSKERVGRVVQIDRLREAGISVVSINYRYVTQAGDTQPPVQVPLMDAARALQFVRSKAGEWNLDKQRISASGSSAGACSSLWLAFHADLADPQSADPISRESTRVWCAAVVGAQTTLDPQQMREWTPNSVYGGHAFGISATPGKPQFEQFLSERERLLPWISEYSPYALVTADDPPVYLTYNAVPGLGEAQKDPTHTSNFGVKLQEHCRELNVACELVYPQAPDVQHKTVTDYLIATLKQTVTQ